MVTQFLRSTPELDRMDVAFPERLAKRIPEGRLLSCRLAWLTIGPTRRGWIDQTPEQDELHVKSILGRAVAIDTDAPLNTLKDGRLIRTMEVALGDGTPERPLRSYPVFLHVRSEADRIGRVVLTTGDDVGVGELLNFTLNSGGFADSPARHGSLELDDPPFEDSEAFHQRVQFTSNSGVYVIRHAWMEAGGVAFRGAGQPYELATDEVVVVIFPDDAVEKMTLPKAWAYGTAAAIFPKIWNSRMAAGRLRASAQVE